MGALGAGSWACHGDIGGSTATGQHADASPAGDLVSEPSPARDLAGDLPSPAGDLTGDLPQTTGGNHVGDPCLNRAGIDVRTFICVEGFVCDSTTMLCENAHVGPLGKDCVGDDECASAHCAGVCCKVACPVVGGCGSNGACTADGQGCVVAPAGTACDVDGGAICLDRRSSLAIAAASCDGLGACQPRGHTSVCADTAACDPAQGVCVDNPAADGGTDSD